MGLTVKYSQSNTDQTDEHDATAFFQLATGGRKMDAAYTHKNFDIRNVSDRTYTGWSPRLALFWNVTPHLGLFANWSKTWHAPVIDEQYEVQGLGSRTATSVDLDPERITSITVGSVSSFDNCDSGTSVCQCNRGDPIAA